MGATLNTSSVWGSLHTPQDITVLSQAGSAPKDHRNMYPVHKVEAKKGAIMQEWMFDVFISNEKNKGDSNVTFFPDRNLFGVGFSSFQEWYAKYTEFVCG